jgi:predicted DNA-binding antitoxin AbrB/MazE fold protein
MVVSVRAVYQEGQLRLLDPVDLVEGQVVNIMIGPESGMPLEQVDARLRAAGLLADMSDLEDAVELTPDERRRLGRLFAGERPSEDLIDEDRGPY